jgi:SpoIID/LytB domain protein
MDKIMRILTCLLTIIFFFYTFVVDSKEASKEADGHLEAALLFKETGEYQKAIDILVKTKIEAGGDRLARHIHQLYYLNGELEKAKISFEKIKNKQWLDFLYMGLINEDLGLQQEALDYYRKSIKLRQTSTALFRMAKIYRKNNQNSKASDTFKKVIDLDSSIRLAYFYAAQVLFEEGDYRQAYALFSKAKQFYPDSTEVDRNFQKVKKKLGEDFFVSKKKDKNAKRKKIKLFAYKPQTDIALVRVGLAKGLDQFSFSCGGVFSASDGKNNFQGKSNTFYTVSFDGKSIKLKNRDSLKLEKEFSKEVTFTSSVAESEKYPFYVLDVTYGQDSYWEKKIDRAYRGKLEVVAEQKKMVLINILSTEEYLYGVLSAEIPAGSPSAALSAQAIAARTIAYRNKNRHESHGFDFCADVHCQVYQGLSAETSSTIAAVNETRGLVLFHEDKPIESFYHSNSGGCLATDVFGKLPYLSEERIDYQVGNLPSSLDEEEQWLIDEPDTFSTRKGRSGFRWQRIYDSEDFYLTLGFKMDDLEAIMVRDKGDCFHYRAIDVVTSEKNYSLNSGLAIRNFFGGLRSSAFKIMLKKTDGKTSKLLLWGAGFGHGAGMSQEGAISMAEKGYDYEEILKHYYPPAILKQIYN